MDFTEIEAPDSRTLQEWGHSIHPFSRRDRKRLAQPASQAATRAPDRRDGARRFIQDPARGRANSGRDQRGRECWIGRRTLPPRST